VAISTPTGPADADRPFDALFNFVHDPATLLVPFGRVAGNRGAPTRPALTA
jgi:RNA-directed DNA polymerase